MSVIIEANAVARIGDGDRLMPRSSLAADSGCDELSALLERVLWIGGPPGCGKTSIAKRIGRRHGLRVYNSDAHTWEHRDRALATGLPAIVRWEAMTFDERWVLSTPAEMAAMSLELERGSMILDDLRRLPASPLTIAEGTPLLPELLTSSGAEAARAVWLLPTAEFQRARLEERGAPAGVSDPARARENRIQRELLMTAEIRRQTGERGLRTLVVDGSRTIEETTAAVETLFADPLAEGPRAETVAERSELLRDANATIAAQLRTHFERIPEAGDPQDATYPFACECGDTNCEASVNLPVSDYPGEARGRQRILAPGHRVFSG